MSLTADQIDTLRELINIGVGRAGGVLSDMVGASIRLSIPEVELVTASELKEDPTGIANARIVSVGMRFSGSFPGSALLVFPTDSAALLAGLLIGECGESDDLDALSVGTLTEVGNTAINGVMGALAELLDSRIEHALPECHEGSGMGLLLDLGAAPSTLVLLVRTRFGVQGYGIKGDILIIFDPGSLEALLLSIDRLCADLAD
jgi:chemotaxis protein CheC